MKTQIDLSRLSKKRQAEVTKVLSFIEGFLPKDASSPWPKDLRRKETPFCSDCVMAFDSTIGASVHLGLVLRDAVKAAIKQVSSANTMQNMVLSGLAGGSYFQSPAYRPLEDLFHHFESQIFCCVSSPGGDPYLVLAQDVRRILDSARRFRKSEAALVKFEDFSLSGMNPFAVITYTLKDCPVYIHVLAIPAQE